MYRLELSVEIEGHKYVASSEYKDLLNLQAENETIEKLIYALQISLKNK